MSGLIIIGFTVNEFYQSAIVSLFNITLVFLFVKNVFRNDTLIIIYFVYHILTLMLPNVMLVTMYSEDVVRLYLTDRLISLPTLLNSNVYILLFDVMLIIYLLICKTLPIKSNVTGNNYYVSDRSKLPILFVLITISYLSKWYLINIDAWFFYKTVDLSNYPMANNFFVLQQLDILVLSYIAYIKVNKLSSKSLNLIFILVTIISFYLAIISTSKERMLMVLLPMLYVSYYSDYRKRIFSVVFLSMVFMPVFFKGMLFYRFNPELDISEIVHEVTNQNVESNIRDNPLIGRLNYQVVVSRVIEHYESYNFNFAYLNNILGLIPRLIWHDKPDVTLNFNSIGQDIGLVGYTDFATSLGISPVGESYMLLGLLGLLITPLIIASLLFYTNSFMGFSSWSSFSFLLLVGIQFIKLDSYVGVLPFLIKSIIIIGIPILLLSGPKEGSRNKKITVFSHR